MPLSDKPDTVELSESIVKQLHAVFGPQPGYRAAHAKGTLLKGTFRPTTDAGSLSSAPHFQSATTPVIVRFSASTGLPTIPDTVGDSFPRGIAVRFVLSDDGHKHSDIVAHSVPLFPARTGEEFLSLFRALGDGEMATASFLELHPKTAEFVGAPKRMVNSWARDQFWGLNAFKLVKSGNGTFVRYIIKGSEGVDNLEPKDIEGRSETYLREEVHERLSKGPFELKLLAQIGQEGDTTNDVTAYWPEDRKVVELGTIVVEGVKEEDSAGAESKRIIFDPVPRVDGIEASDDPLIDVRATVYLISGRERRAA